jgi:hypothetical protein
MKVLEGYFNLLSTSPDRIDSLLMWSVCTTVLWIMMYRNKERMIKGMEGANLLWEGGEQVTYYSLVSFIPIIFRTAFFKESSTAQLIALYIITGLIAYQVFGRYIFDWALALKGGLSSVPQQQKEQQP